MRNIRKKIPVLAFAGWSGSGKTTLIEKVVRLLKERGLRVAVIKHDAHGVQADHEGKDSWRFTMAGADISLVSSAETTMAVEKRPLSLKEVLGLVHDVDLVLVEGYKDKGLTQIGLRRKESGKDFTAGPERFAALVTDGEAPAGFCGPVFHPDDADGVAHFIIENKERFTALQGGRLRYPEQPEDARALNEELLSFIDRSPVCFQAADNIRNMLLDSGCTELPEQEQWKLEKGGKYFTVRNGSSIISFRIPEGECAGFQIADAHSDSPSFKLKENPDIEAEGYYLKANVEKYGGMLCAPWFDRPLSIAGRIVVETETGIRSIMVDLEKDAALIPSMAIHLNRTVNDGYAYNIQKDLLPLTGTVSSGEGLMDLIAHKAGTEKEKILGSDLFLYNRQKGTIWGTGEGFISAPRLDDLQCAFACVKGFLLSEGGRSIAVCAVFDNEEVGSRTKQGAASTFLRDVLERIGESFGWTRETFVRMLRNSFMISADNAQAVHPNHTDLYDPVNRPLLNGGIVLKYNAEQKYTTDAVSAALFRKLCGKAEVPLQTYVNRSDIAGGSTLGNIANTQVSLNTVDIGLPQLAMHSPYETAGALDTAYLVKVMRLFYDSTVKAGENGEYLLLK